MECLRLRSEGRDFTERDKLVLNLLFPHQSSQPRATPAQEALLSAARPGGTLASGRHSLRPHCLTLPRPTTIDLELQRKAEERSDQDDDRKYADAAKRR